MAIKYDCFACKKQVTATKNNRYRTHTTGDGEPCESSSADIPEHILAQPVTVGDPPDVPRAGVDYQQCPQCDRKVRLTRMGYFEPHDQTLRGGDRCPVSGVRAKHAKRREDVLLPGDEPASVIPKVTAQQEITSRAPTSTSAGAAGTRRELPPGSGGPVEPSSTGATAVPAPVTEGTSARPVHETNLARYPMAQGAVDWSKVGDLKHLPDPLTQARVAETSVLAASSSASTASSSPASTTISTGSSTSSAPAPSIPSGAPGGPGGPASAGRVLRVLQPGLLAVVAVLQPFSPFCQPTEYTGPVKPPPMGEAAKELATKIKETFYAYSNRKTNDNRSAQTTLGPSEIGTPCDRRLAMSLMGVPAVNPGGDGWAAFVGTCTHVGMAEVYTFADAGTGRYAVELPVFLGVPTVPRGTTDLLDRRDGTVVDWKVMGAYSLKKFKEDGPSQTYRTQAHVYGLGAERAGEKVRNVAVVGLPRAGSSLDEMHVWTEPYNRKLAQDALARVERIANDVQGFGDNEAAVGGTLEPMKAAVAFPTGDDCRFCPFHLKNDKEMKRGCPGK